MVMKRMIALSAAALFVGGAAFAAPKSGKTAKSSKAPAAKQKIVDVKTCPMTGEAVKGKGVGNEVVGNYRVYFCCAGCQPEFDKLSSKDKQKKVAALVAKQKPGANKAKS